MADIFISYSREDAAFVDALILSLIEYGWTVWSDKSGMAEGRPFDQQIEDAIVQSSVALVIWSRGSVKSRWVRAEAAFALDDEKLIPILADDTDPPLQFLHIQSVSLAQWNRTTDDNAFRKLAVMLSRRLDRVGRVPVAEETATVLPPAKTTFNEAINALVDFRQRCLPRVSEEYSKYFVERTFFITQFCAAFGFCTVTLFGLIDVIAKSDRPELTQYRFMVTGPLLLVLLGLSFAPIAKRFSQTYGFIFACTVLLTNIRAIRMAEDKFPVTTGAATTTFMVILGISMILPLRVGPAAALGLLVVIVQEVYIRMMPTHVPAGLHAGYTISVLALSLALTAMAFFRDRVMRQSFLEYSQLSIRNTELKERVMALAALQGQASKRPPLEEGPLSRPPGE